MSELLPHLAAVVDDITFVKSMQTDAFNHAPAQIFMNTGSTQFGRPSMGAWTTYGLGSESQDLPGFVVVQHRAKGASGGASNYGCGFLPTAIKACSLRGQGDPVLYSVGIRRASIARDAARLTLDTIKRLNERHLEAVGDPEIATRINSFELAYRMQTSAPELMEIAKESKETGWRCMALSRARPAWPTSARHARRLVERGVRFVQIFHEAWIITAA